MAAVLAAETARLRAAAAPALAAGSAAVGTGYVAAVDPSRPGHYPTCPFLLLTGAYCPGCGSLRAVHALAHGHLAEAVGLNAFAVAMVPLLAVIWVRWLSRRLAGRDRPAPAPARRIRGLAGAVVVFWVLRNLPFGAALAP